MDQKIYVLGEIDIDQADFKRVAMEPMFAISGDRFVFISYDDLKKTDVASYLNPRKVIAIILGANPHHMPGLSGANSLSHYFVLNQSKIELPFLIDMVNQSFSKQKLRLIFAKIIALLAAPQLSSPSPILLLDDQDHWQADIPPVPLDLQDHTLDTVVAELKSIPYDIFMYLEQKPLSFDLLMRAAIELDRRMGKSNYSHSKKARAIYNYIIDDTSLDSAPYKAEAYFRDGICLYNGRGVKRNNLRAKTCFEKAESLGYVEATYMLYFIYKRLQAETHHENGAKLAVNKLNEALKKGFHLAAFHLGEYNLFETAKPQIAALNFHRYVQYCRANKSRLTNEERYRYAQCLHFGYDHHKFDWPGAQEMYHYLIAHDYPKAYYGMGLLLLHHPEVNSSKSFKWYWQKGIASEETRCYYALALHEMATKATNSHSHSYLLKAMKKGYIKAVIMLIYSYWKANQHDLIGKLVDEAQTTEDIDVTFILDHYHRNANEMPVEVQQYADRELATHRLGGTYTPSNHIHQVIHEVAPQKRAIDKPVVIPKEAKPTPKKQAKGTVKIISGGILPSPNNKRR